MKKVKLVLGLFVLLFVLVNVSVMGTLAEDSITKVVDCAGREVEIKGEVNRIVDLTFLDGVRTLVELGAQDCLVGMSEMDHQAYDGTLSHCYVIVSQAAPELKDIANVGDHTDPNIEMILSLKPDVVFVCWNMGEYAEMLEKQLNIPVVCVSCYGSFTYDVFEIVGKVVGEEKRAQELIEFTKNKLQKITSITNEILGSEKKRIYYYARPYIGDPRTNGHYEAFEIAGGKNVAAQGKNVPYGVFKVSREQIAVWNPDYIFKHSCTVKDMKGWHTIETIKQDEVVRATKAVKNDNVYPTRGHMRGWDIATEAAEVFYLAKILYPDKFVDIDVEKEGNEILEKFYGIKGLYSDMSKKVGLYEWK